MFENLRRSFRAPRFRDLLRWQLGLHPERWPRTARSGVPVPFVANDGSVLRGAAHDTLTWIGHASFLLQLGGRSLLIDPVLCHALSGVVQRNVPPGLDWPALPHIDAVLLTHNHRDHMDVPTLKRLGPEPACTSFRAVSDRGSTATVSRGPSKWTGGRTRRWAA